MAVPTNIKTLLSGNVVEWARIEFKETWDAEASLKTICAFANDIDNWGGGYIVIGVKEKGGRPDILQGVPVEKIDSYLKDMLNKCKRIQPEYLPIVEVADYDGKSSSSSGLLADIYAPIPPQNPWPGAKKNAIPSRPHFSFTLIFFIIMKVKMRVKMRVKHMKWNLH